MGNYQTTVRAEFLKKKKNIGTPNALGVRKAIQQHGEMKTTYPGSLHFYYKGKNMGPLMCMQCGADKSPGVRCERTTCRSLPLCTHHLKSILKVELRHINDERGYGVFALETLKKGVPIHGKDANSGLTFFLLFDGMRVKVLDKQRGSFNANLDVRSGWETRTEQKVIPTIITHPHNRVGVKSNLWIDNMPMHRDLEKLNKTGNYMQLYKKVGVDEIYGVDEKHDFGEVNDSAYAMSFNSVVLDPARFRSIGSMLNAGLDQKDVNCALSNIAVGLGGISGSVVPGARHLIHTKYHFYDKDYKNEVRNVSVTGFILADQNDAQAMANNYYRTLLHGPVPKGQPSPSVVVTPIRDIMPGEELLINYSVDIHSKTNASHSTK